MGFDDAEAHRQADAKADSRRLGREVRLEYPRPKMCRNAGTVVGNDDANQLRARVETAGHPYVPTSRMVLQRLLRIDDQIEQHLVELIGVGVNQRNILGEIQLDFYAACANGISG